MNNNQHESPKSESALGATASEFNEFLQRLRGKNPQEVLGVIAQSGLARATVQATVACVVLLAACTVGPYVWSKQNPPAKKTAASKEPDKTDKGESAKTPAAAPPGTTAPATNPVTADNTKKPPVSKEALDKLGLTETKTGTPKVNPLEKSSDDLLNDLDKKK